MAKKDKDEVDKDSGMTTAEKAAYGHLVAAWDAFVVLPKMHPSDTHDFLTSMQRLQHLMAMRVLRREHPKYWYSQQEGE